MTEDGLSLNNKIGSVDSFLTNRSGDSEIQLVSSLRLTHREQATPLLPPKAVTPGSSSFDQRQG